MFHEGTSMFLLHEESYNVVIYIGTMFDFQCPIP